MRNAGTRGKEKKNKGLVWSTWRPTTCLLSGLGAATGVGDGRGALQSDLGHAPTSGFWCGEGGGGGRDPARVIISSKNTMLLLDLPR